MPQPKVRIWWDRDLQGYYVETPYSRAFVEGLKLVVPASDRGWDPASKIWTITERFFPAIKVAAERIFPGQVNILTREQAEKATAPSAVKIKTLNEVLLDFVLLLPNDALQKAYRVAAMTLHPDRGGDMEKMSRLNALWQRIEMERINKGS